MPAKEKKKDLIVTLLSVITGTIIAIIVVLIGLIIYACTVYGL